MSSKRRGARFWLSAWLPVILGVGIILVESTSFFGADHTTGPLRGIWEWVFGPVTNARWHTIHMVIRKAGHFTGYGLIGLAWLRAWWKTMPQAAFARAASFAFLGTALIASCDEFHQSFLPNRTASPYDVLLDCSGAVALMCVVYLFMRLSSPNKLARAA